MIIPCEISTKSVVPAIKAAIARDLVEVRGLSQTRAAEILGISQSAVCRYSQGMRGSVISVGKVKEAAPIIKRMADLLLTGNYSRNEFVRSFCAVCSLVRGDGLMCPFCYRTESEIEKKGCSYCLKS